MNNRRVSFSEDTKIQDGSCNNIKFYFFILNYLSGKIYSVEDILKILSEEEIKIFIDNTNDIMKRLRTRNFLVSCEKIEEQYIDQTEPYWESEYWSNMSKIRQQNLIKTAIIKNGSRDYSSLVPFSQYNKIKKLLDLLLYSLEYMLL
jgi:hypothetical protein